MKNEPRFVSGVCTMGDRHRCLSKSSKRSKYRTITSIRAGLLERSIDSIWSKALDGMSLQVGSGSTILGILIMTNATSLDFASFGGTLEEMERLAIVGVDLDVTLEEAVDGRAPGFLETFFNAVRSAPELEWNGAERT
jgi:hypothetical protein